MNITITAFQLAVIIGVAAGGGYWYAQCRFTGQSRSFAVGYVAAVVLAASIIAFMTAALVDELLRRL